MFRVCFFVWTSCMVIFLAGCNSNEIHNIEEVAPTGTYFDYAVWGDEESGNMTVKLQYRAGDASGTSMRLQEPARVEFDGQILEPDSARMNGAWYELNMQVKSFAGKHIIVYTDTDKKQYREEFDFNLFSIKEEIPAIITREDLVIKLDGLAREDYVKVLLTDTAFYSRGIDRLDTVWDGQIKLTKRDLANLRNGPISLEIYREKEKELTETGDGAGRLFISYGLRRAFELKD